MPRVRSGRTACPKRARSDGKAWGFTVTQRQTGMPPDLRLSWSAARGPKPSMLVMPVRSRSPALIVSPYPSAS